ARSLLGWRPLPPAPSPRRRGGPDCLAPPLRFGEGAGGGVRRGRGPFRSRLLRLVNRNRGGPITGPSRTGARLRGASLLDDCFQMIEIASERIAASGRQTARRLRATADELLVDGDNPRLLQLLEVDAEVAVGHFQRIAQLGKRQRGGGGQHRNDRQP